VVSPVLFMLTHNNLVQQAYLVVHKASHCGWPFFMPENRQEGYMNRPLRFPKTVGVRLSKEDGVKLEHLCVCLERQPSEVLRLLVRLAQPVDVVPVRFLKEDRAEREVCQV